MLSAREKKELSRYKSKSPKTTKVSRKSSMLSSREKAEASFTRKNKTTSSNKTFSSGMYVGKNRTPFGKDQAKVPEKRPSIKKLGSKRKPVDKLLSDIQRILKR